jgi:hypothetical protein
MSNSSSVDALAQQHQLGQLVREYGWNQQLYRGYRRTLWITFPLVIFPSLVIIGIPFLIIWGVYAWVVFRRCSDSRPKVLCYEYGFIDRQKMQIVRYDEIAIIQLSQVEYLHAYNRTGGNIANMRLDCIVKTKPGKKIKFQQYIENVIELGHFLQQQALPFQLNDSIEQLKQGEAISFDSFKMSSSGIHQGKKLLSWDQVDSTEIKSIASHNGSYVAVIIRESGYKDNEYWANRERNWFPNLLLFFTLIQYLKGGTEIDSIPQPILPKISFDKAVPSESDLPQENHQFPTLPTVEKRPLREHLLIGLNAAILPITWWSILIVCVTIAGYPGVMMITPLAWLILPFQAGSVYAEKAIARKMRPQLRYSALIGVFIGILLGVLCAIVSWFFMDIPANEVEKTVNFLLGMTKVGCLVCPLFSMLSTYVQKGWRLAN